MTTSILFAPMSANELADETTPYLRERLQKLGTLNETNDTAALAHEIAKVSYELSQRGVDTWTPDRDVSLYTGLALSVLFVAAKGLSFDLRDVRRSLLGDRQVENGSMDDAVTRCLAALVSRGDVSVLHWVAATPKQWIIREPVTLDRVRRLFVSAYPELQTRAPLSNDDAMLAQLDDDDSAALDSIVQKSFGVSAEIVRAALVVKFKADREQLASECVRLARLVALDSTEFESYDKLLGHVALLAHNAARLTATIELERAALVATTSY